MIDLDFIERLIAALDQSSVDSLEIERGGTRVRLAKTPSGTVTALPFGAPSVPQVGYPAPGAPAPPLSAAPSPADPSPAQAPASAASSDLIEVTSPMVGTFYLAPAPDAPPYAEVGSRIGLGDTLCIIEAMKLMNELESEVKGTIVEVCAENAQPVEFGQVLFRVDPS